MPSFNRVSLLLVAVLTAVSLGAPAALAQTPQGDNVAAEVNTKDNSNVFDLSFNIRRVMAGAVDTDNAAAAVASCESCRTIAVAIQVVLILSDPDVVTTDNLALALNVECTTCETMALAYQYVLTTDGPVHFTADGNKAINDLLKQISDIGSDETLSLDEIAAQIDPLVDELYAVVDTELVAAGKPATEGETQEAVDTSTPPPTSTDPVASPEPSVEPTTESTPTPAESPTEAEPSPSEEPSPATTP
jgi:hypothetical protein